MSRRSACTGRTKIFRRDATELGEAGTMQPFGLVFADPPYGKGLGETALRSARDGGWLLPGALCVVEEAAAAPFAPGDGFSRASTSAAMARRSSGSSKRLPDFGLCLPLPR